MSGYSTPCAPCGGCVATKPMPLCIDSLTFTDLPPNTLVTITFENVDSDGSIIKKDRSKDAQRADHMDAFRYLCNGKVVQGMIR